MSSVLLVEDDQDLRFELSDYLSSVGYTVHGVGTMSAAEQVLDRKGSMILRLVARS